MKKHGHRVGGKKSPTYTSWSMMKERCYRVANDNYQFYGAKGVVVCDEWRTSFDKFLEDMGERPEGMTLDRIDPTGNYSKANCKWATASEQGRNKRRKK